MEMYDGLAREYEFQNTVAERPGSAGENGARLRKAEAERKRKGLDHGRAKSTSGVREERRSRLGFVIGNPRRARKAAGIVSKAVQQSSGVVVIYVILDQ